MDRYFSPKSPSGSLVFSVLAHGLVYASLLIILNITFSKHEVHQDYLDLGYQVFDAPPQPEQKEHKVVRSKEPVTPKDIKAITDDKPKELQDEKSDIAGTQTVKKENDIGSESNGNAASTPYYKIKPKYPKAALVAGIEGWVLLQIDINEKGEVENVRVVGGEQRNMFEAEAKRAVAQYKYRPFTDGTGKPLRKTDWQVRVNFHLVDEEQGS
jgi:protein TonB